MPSRQSNMHAYMRTALSSFLLLLLLLLLLLDPTQNARHQL